MILTGSMKVTLATNRTFTGDLESGASNISAAIAAAFANGTGDNQIDLVYQDTETLITDATKTYDLDALVDPITGDAVVFAKVKAIVFYSKLTANKVLTLGAGDFQGPFSGVGDSVAIPPEGFFVAAAPITGWVVTPTSGNGLLITNASGGPSEYDIYIIGTSA